MVEDLKLIELDFVRDDVKSHIVETIANPFHHVLVVGLGTLLDKLGDSWGCEALERFDALEE